MMKYIIDLDEIPKKDLASKTFDQLKNDYPEHVQMYLGPIKEISDRYEQRLRDNNFFAEPKSTEFDALDRFDNRVEFKYTTGITQKKWQQVKPRCRDYFLFFEIENGKVDTYFLYPSQISSVAGKENKEEGKLMLQRQHRGNIHEGQVSKTGEFLNIATHMGTYDFDPSNLLSKENVRDVIDIIQQKLTYDRAKKPALL